MKLQFENDYMEGGHPAILQRLYETNFVKEKGYGNDQFCKNAEEILLNLCECPKGKVYFLSGGTQTNIIAIDSILNPWQGVISVDTGHINVHEIGAVERCGHKILVVPNADGKLTANLLEEFLINYYNDESCNHMIEPGMVYISHPTELGTLYSCKELQDLREVCDKYHILLYMDGARLGYGLMAINTDVTLQTIAQICDLFYIGGTKVGAYIGEALVFTRSDLANHFSAHMKQRGFLLAKSRLLGVQFETLFSNGLYFEISKHAINMAEKLKKGISEKNYSFYCDSPTNQQFVIVNNETYKKLAEEVDFTIWQKLDQNNLVIRLVTNWATREEDIEALLKLF